jgi:hypothetical protein
MRHFRITDMNLDTRKGRLRLLVSWRRLQRERALVEECRLVEEWIR